MGNSGKLLSADESFVGEIGLRGVIGLPMGAMVDFAGMDGTMGSSAMNGMFEMDLLRARLGELGALNVRSVASSLHALSIRT